MLYTIEPKTYITPFIDLDYKIIVDDFALILLSVIVQHNQS